MKKLEYNFYGLKDTENLIDKIIVPSTPKSSCWWSRLKSIGYNQKANIRTCPAVNDVLVNSFLLKAPCDMVISVSKDSEYTYDSECDMFSIESHHSSQYHTDKDNIFKGKLNIKFVMPVLIRTDNVPLMFLQPMYHNSNTSFMVLNGTITGTYTDKQPLLVNILVDIPKTDTPVTYNIKSGDVLAYLWSPERLELSRSKELKGGLIPKHLRTSRLTKRIDIK